jgi:CMP-N-acetylneuraminic acid synthetase
MLSYVMPAERSFDIDYPYQMRIAEIMAEEYAKRSEI